MIFLLATKIQSFCYFERRIKNYFATLNKLLHLCDKKEHVLFDLRSIFSNFAPKYTKRTEWTTNKRHLNWVRNQWVGC